MNETASLEKTLITIENTCKNDVKEYLIVTCSKTQAASRQTIKKMLNDFPHRIVHIEQTKPFLGGAVQDAFLRASASHVLMMASDLETDPENVTSFIAESKKNPTAIVTGSRWLQSHSFDGYSPIKLVLNFIFQKFFSILYGVNLSDMTFGYRIFPTRVVQQVEWEEMRHPFLFETLVKPIRLGLQVIEIPTHWKKREEGESSNPFWRNFAYFPVGISVRFRSAKTLLHESPILEKEKSPND